MLMTACVLFDMQLKSASWLFLVYGYMFWILAIMEGTFIYLWYALFL